MQTQHFIAALITALNMLCFAHAQGEMSFEHLVIDEVGPVDPWGKSVGDINGDGRVDLIVGGSKSGGLVWYENPSWKKQTIAAAGQWSTDHAPADMDGDGDIDLIALTKNSICWFENPSWQIREIDQRVLHDVEAADFDLDGDLDLVARNQGEFGQSGAQLHFYRNESGEAWLHFSIACENGEGLAVADIDLDGDTDVAINAYWFENQGGMESHDWQCYRYGERWSHGASFVALADINLDGRLDIVLSPSELAGGRYRISWFEAPLNAADIPWQEHLVAPDVESVHHFVGAADFDLDGDVDVVTAQMEQGVDPDEITIFRNAGDSATWNPTVIATQGSHSMRVLDVDGDGDSDLFGANWQGNTVDLWINATRTPQQASMSMPSWQYILVDATRDQRCFGVSAGDIDHDGDLDIAAGAFLYRNPAAGMLGDWQRMELPAQVDANFIVDIDGDDCADILAQRLPEILWLEADDRTASSFSSETIAVDLPTTGHGGSQGFAVGDLSGDGRPEYVLSTGNGIFYLSIPEEPHNTHWPKMHVTEQAPEEGLALGDIDADGALDIIAWFGSGSGSNEIGWWRNPRLKTQQQRGWHYYPIGTVLGTEGDRVAVGDFNHDGAMDVAATGTTNSAEGSCVYWFQNPSDMAASWMRHAVATDVGAMNSMSTADINGDGSIDIVTGEHRGEQRVIVYCNADRGRDWQPYLVDAGKESHLGTYISDLDNDGDLDIVSIGWDDFRSLHLWRNDRPSKSSQ